MRGKTHLLAILLGLSLGAGHAETLESSAKLPVTVSKVLAAYKMPEESLSVYVQEIGQDAPLLALNPDVGRNPASTIKLLTTYVALEELGPTFRWKTEADPRLIVN